jgi:hypothetical protein
MNEIGGRSGLLFGFEGVASLVGPPIGPLAHALLYKVTYPTA